MKTLIIYISVHHKNTEKIAKIFATTLKAEIKSLEQINTTNLSAYDLIGFGSGLYFFKHHKYLLDFAQKLPQTNNKKAFIFSTSGIKRINILIRHKPLKTILQSKNFEIIGEFNCPGFDTVGPLRIIGGINKGRPNEKDLNQAQVFATNLKEKLTI